MSTVNNQESVDRLTIQLAWDLDTSKGKCLVFLYLMLGQGMLLASSGGMNGTVRYLALGMALSVSAVLYFRWSVMCNNVAKTVTAIINNGTLPSGGSDIIPGYCKREFALIAMIINFQIGIFVILSSFLHYWNSDLGSITPCI